VDLERTLAGQLVTSKILLGYTARPSEFVRDGVNSDFSVHTLVDAQTGQIRYRVEGSLLLFRPDVSLAEMQSSFEAGTSFRITAVHLKDDRLEINLRQTFGKSTVVKLMFGKGWQSRYDAASVEEKLARVFSFGQPAQQEMEAEQAPPQERPVETPTQSQVPATQVETAAQPTTPATPVATAESPANRVSVPPSPPQQPEQREPATPESARPAVIDCNAIRHIALFSLPDASSSPVGTLQCGEKVLALGQQQDWARVRTQQGVEGYAYRGYVSYGKPFFSEQAPQQPAAQAPQEQPKGLPPCPFHSVLRNGWSSSRSDTTYECEIVGDNSLQPNTCYMWDETKTEWNPYATVPCDTPESLASVKPTMQPNIPAVAPLTSQEGQQAQAESPAPPPLPPESPGFFESCYSWLCSSPWWDLLGLLCLGVLAFFVYLAYQDGANTFGEALATAIGYFFRLLFAIIKFAVAAVLIVSFCWAGLSVLAGIWAFITGRDRKS
jgi:hypothetical protein